MDQDHPQETPNEIPLNSTSESGESTNLENLVIYESQIASFPRMDHYDERLNSFKDWPKSLRTRPEELTEAGFFYTGNGDITICFQCGLKLNNWEETDDPWTKHAKWYIQCSFLLLKKGKEFIDQAQAEFKKELEIIEAASTTQTPEPEPSTSTGQVVKKRSGTFCPLDHLRYCKICFVNEAGIVFLPCGHLIACYDCGHTRTICPNCGKPCRGFMRAYLS